VVRARRPVTRQRAGPVAALPLTRRWARFGTPDRRWFVHLPEGGFCLSAFLIVRDRRGAILLGRPRLHEAWPDRGCVPFWRLREFIRERVWVLPASHFLMDEAPDAAARRVARDWAGVPSSSPKLIAVTSELFPTGRVLRVGRSRHPLNHWALCFIFELNAGPRRANPPAWEELRFFSAGDLPTLKIGRGHEDLLRAWRDAVSGSGEGDPRSAPGRPTHPLPGSARGPARLRSPSGRRRASSLPSSGTAGRSRRSPGSPGPTR